MSVVPTRPLLRYFGGKWQLRHWIIGHMPDHQFYAEPFAGAASVLLSKPPAPGGEIINDLNREVLNLFRVMRHSGRSKRLMQKLDWTPYSQAELREASEPTTNPVEMARRTIVRSFMGIEGSGTGELKSGFRMGGVNLARLDQDGKKTFRNCATDWSHWKEALELTRRRLSKVMIYERDALDFIGLMNHPDCLVYVDPPYDHEARGKNRYSVEFTDHAALVTALLATKSMVLLSGYECPEYQPLMDAGWRRVEKDYRANMSKDRRVEVLWMNYSTTEIDLL